MKRRIAVLVIIMLLAIVGAGCSWQGNPTPTPTPTPTPRPTPTATPTPSPTPTPTPSVQEVLTPFTKAEQQLYAGGFTRTNERDLSASEQYYNGLSYEPTDSYYDEDYEVSYKKVTATTSYDDLCTFGANDDLFYPGALLNFNNMAPIEIDRAPLTISLRGLEGTNNKSEKNLSTTVQNPNLATVRNAIKGLISSNVSSTAEIPAQISMDIKEIKSEEEFNLNLGFGLQVSKFHVADEFNLAKNKKQTHFAIILKQTYFTVDVVRQNSNRGEYQFFANNVSAENARAIVGEDKIPVYCNSVAYGRIAIISVSSNYTFDEIKNKLTLGWGKMSQNPGSSASKGLSVDFELEIENLAKNQDVNINAFVYGGSEEMAYGALNVTGVDEIANLFNQNENVESVCGLPISYSFRHLDGSLAKFQSTNEYIVKDVKYVPKYIADWSYLDELVESQEIRKLTELKLDLNGMYTTPNANKLITVPQNIEKLEIVGPNDIRDNVVYNNLSVAIASRTKPLTLHLTNISANGVTTLLETGKEIENNTPISKYAPRPFIKTESLVPITLEIEGDVTITGGENCAAIEVPNLIVNVAGIFNVYGANGVAEKIINGATAITATNVTLKTATQYDQVFIYGGNGVTPTTAGANGGNGGAAIVAENVTVNALGMISITGGNGGNGAIGKIGKAGTGGDSHSNYTNVNNRDYMHGGAGTPGEQGGAGGSGGSGGSGIVANESLNIQNGKITLYAGKGGAGGNGGNRGKPIPGARVYIIGGVAIGCVIVHPLAPFVG